MPGIMANMTAIPDSRYKPAGTGGEVAVNTGKDKPRKRRRKLYCYYTNDQFEFMVSVPLPLRDFCIKYKLQTKHVLYCGNKGQRHKQRSYYKIVAFENDDSEDNDEK